MGGGIGGQGACVLMLWDGIVMSWESDQDSATRQTGALQYFAATICEFCSDVMHTLRSWLHMRITEELELESFSQETLHARAGSVQP